MERVYATYGPRLQILDHEQGRWESETTQLNEPMECIDVHEDAPHRVFCGTAGAGLWASVDTGSTFDRVATETIDPTIVTSVVVDPTDPTHILVGTEPSRIYESTDAGDTWHQVHGITDLPSASAWSFPPRPDTHHVRWIAIAPDDSRRWYVGIEAGAFLVTPDGGATWIDRPNGARRDNHWIATHPEEPERVYAAAGDGYAESYDRGESWQHPQDGLDHRYVWSLAVDAGNPDVRMVSAARGAHRAHRPAEASTHVYRRVGSDPWERVTGLPTGDGVVRPVLAAGAAPGTFLAVSNHGSYRTDDHGETWNRLCTWEGTEPVPRGIAVVGGR